MDAKRPCLSKRKDQVQPVIIIIIIIVTSLTAPPFPPPKRKKPTPPIDPAMFCLVADRVALDPPNSLEHPPPEASYENKTAL